MSQRNPNIFHQLDRGDRFPYSRNEYVRRFLWLIVRWTIFRIAVPRLHGLQRVLLRMFGAKLAPTSTIRTSTRIIHPWLLSVGEHSSIAERVNVWNLGPISVGDHTTISQDVTLCAGTHDYTQPNLPLQRPPIHIGSGVWICAEAFIGPGVTIGDNAVVGARAVVTKDVPPGTVVAGNPARVVKQRPMPGISGP